MAQGAAARHLSPVSGSPATHCPERAPASWSLQGSLARPISVTLMEGSLWHTQKVLGIRLCSASCLALLGPPESVMRLVGICTPHCGVDGLDVSDCTVQAGEQCGARTQFTGCAALAEESDLAQFVQAPGSGLLHSLALGSEPVSEPADGSHSSSSALSALSAQLPESRGRHPNGPGSRCVYGWGTGPSGAQPGCTHPLRIRGAGKCHGCRTSVIIPVHWASGLKCH